MNRYDKEKARKNIPFSVIQAACRGSPDEMLIVIQHYTPYIVSLSKRRMIDLCGNESQMNTLLSALKPSRRSGVPVLIH